MLTKSTRIKLIAFALIAVLGVGYCWWRYAGGQKLIGNPSYPVTLQLANAGGIFANAEVTYEGVTVGRVGDLTLTNDGLNAELDIDRSAPPIPTDVDAVVVDRSAVGEQYVDLRPKTDNGPYLADVPTDARKIDERNNPQATPPPVQDTLNNIDSLANSVPKGSLQTVVSELGTGFNGTGSDLSQIMDSLSAFTTAAQQNLPQTAQLIDAGKTVLDTQNDEASAIKSFSSNLKDVAAQLKTSDPDLRHLITSAPQAADQITGVLNEDGTNLSDTVANLLTTANLLKPRDNGIEMALIVYPWMGAAVNTDLVDPKTKHIRLGLALNLFNPPSCVRGYEGTKKRPGNATTQAQPNYNAYCAEPTGSAIDVRGSENVPVAGVPKVATPGGTGSSQSQSTMSNGPFGQALGPSSLAQLLGITGL